MQPLLFSEKICTALICSIMLWLETASAMAPVRELQESRRRVSTVHTWLQTGSMEKKWQSLTIRVLVRAQMHARTKLIEMFNKRTKLQRECLRAVIERLSNSMQRVAPQMLTVPVSHTPLGPA